MSHQDTLPAPNSSRLLALDLLRLLAVVMVLGRHMEEPPSDWASPLKPLVYAWYENGWLGVELFFVLSGFLVSGLLFSEYKKHGNISPTRFYMRRGWKIYPAFYFLIGFAYFYELFVRGYKIRDRNIFSELLFIQSYQIPYWNHTWTLAVEEHFYLLLPIVLLALVWRNRGAADPFKALPYVVVATAVLALGARVVNCWMNPKFSMWTHSVYTHLRIDALFVGVAIGYFYHFHGERFQHVLRPWRYALIAAGIALLATASLLPKIGLFYTLTFGFIHYFVGSAALMVGALMCEIPRHSIILVLATLGTFSYSVYLWHMALMRWAIPHLREVGMSWHLRTALYLIGAFVIGIAMAKLVELPVLRFRDRKFPSRSADLPQVPPAAATATEPLPQAA
jgi:peptidoglycan/LPS O-acetylase OafA/YrhL